MNTNIKQNFLCKSEIIRDINQRYPHYTNEEIKAECYKRFGFRPQSNLIINVIGKETSRKELMSRRIGLINLAKKYLEACNNEISVATQHLRMAM